MVKNVQLVRALFSFGWAHANLCTESDMDYATRLMSLEDDPTLRIFTFRMCFLSLGLSCFGAVLGQIFVGLSLLSS